MRVVAGSFGRTKLCNQGNDENVKNLPADRFRYFFRIDPAGNVPVIQGRIEKSYTAFAAERMIDLAYPTRCRRVSSSSRVGATTRFLCRRRPEITSRKM